jgi:epoxyqueuosine reductase QueG
MTRIDRQELDRFLRRQGAVAWAAARNDPRLPAAPALPRAISFLYHVEPSSLEALERGPTAAYYAEYVRINERLVATGAGLVRLLAANGYRAERVDDDAPEGPGYPPVFASKTAATQAGLGWIGKTALLVTRDWGPAVRLGTVFTDLELETGTPLERGACGRCRACVDACPAGAGRERRWRAGTALEDLVDAAACERHQLHYPKYDNICGICIWVCPFTRRAFRSAEPTAPETEAAAPDGRQT